ncbi:MAG: response regulator transcription factor [Gammaproteobacteria bacterium]
MERKDNSDMDSYTIRVPTNIMLVDDHALVRSGLKHFLQKSEKIRVVAEASRGEEALQMALAVRPDIVLMDFDMPGISGLEATQRLLRDLPNTKVIIVSAFTHEAIILRLLKIGASGFVAKGAHAMEIVEAINTVNNGGRYINKRLAARLTEGDLKDGELASFDSLSNKELLIVLMIAQGYRNKKISERLHLSPKTVSTYCSSSLKKLGVKNKVQLTLKAIEHQLVDLESV